MIFYELLKSYNSCANIGVMLQLFLPQLAQMCHAQLVHICTCLLLHCVLLCKKQQLQMTQTVDSSVIKLLDIIDFNGLEKITF